jgi:hypothetical protein
MFAAADGCLTYDTVSQRRGGESPSRSKRL